VEPEFHVPEPPVAPPSPDGRRGRTRRRSGSPIPPELDAWGTGLDRSGEMQPWEEEDSDYRSYQRVPVVERSTSMESTIPLKKVPRMVNVSTTISDSAMRAFGVRLCEPDGTIEDDGVVVVAKKDKKDKKKEKKKEEKDGEARDEADEEVAELGLADLDERAAKKEPEKKDKKKKEKKKDEEDGVDESDTTRSTPAEKEDVSLPPAPGEKTKKGKDGKKKDSKEEPLPQMAEDKKKGKESTKKVSDKDKKKKDSQHSVPAIRSSMSVPDTHSHVLLDGETTQNLSCSPVLLRCFV
jgi:hypothetical protein